MNWIIKTEKLMTTCFFRRKKQEYINQIVAAIRNVREEYADEIKQLDEGEDIDVNEIYTDLNEQILQIDKLSDLDTENQGEFLIEMMKLFNDIYENEQILTRGSR